MLKFFFSNRYNFTDVWCVVSCLLFIHDDQYIAAGITLLVLAAISVFGREYVK